MIVHDGLAGTQWIDGNVQDSNRKKKSKIANVPKNLAVLCDSEDNMQVAALTAQQLGVPFVEEMSEKFSWYLMWDGIWRLAPLDPELGGVLYVDFMRGANAYRRRFGGGRNQALSKAVGIRVNKKPTILDVTAGLARDAFVLFSLGCRVRMIERSPVLGILIQDALKRAGDTPEMEEKIRSRLRLEIADSMDILRRLDSGRLPDVIYMDPMYPQRQKSSAVKKDMRYLREIVGEDPDSGKLFDMALTKARRRVVVKRPQYAPPMNDVTPHHSIEGKTTRYDVYMI